MAIEIGTVVVQNASVIAGYSFVNYNVAATGSGTITAVTFEVKTQTANLTIIIFEEVAALTYTARSYQVLGVKTAGLHSDVAVSLAVVTGDYIGYYYSAGAMYVVSYGGAGSHLLAGDQKECVSAEFAVSDPDGRLYLYGTGAGESVGGGAGMGVAEAIFAGEL